MMLHIHIFIAIVTIINCQQYEEPPTSFSPLPISSPIPELPFNTKALPCRTANGVPSPVYRWMKNGQFLSASNTTDTVLKITNISPLDAGDYQCVASNRVGAIVSLKAAVAVAYMSTFASGPTQQVSVTEGYAVVLPLPPLDCYPAPTVTWYSGTSSITSDVQQYHITLRNNLVILCANTSRDSGSQYRAMASNSYTSQYTQSPTFQLTINSAGNRSADIPAEIVIPPSNTSGVEMVDSSIQLECVANSRPLNFLVLSWYKVTSSNRTRIFADSIKYSLSLYGQVLTIRDPRRDDSGIFQCEAVFSRPGSAPGLAVVAQATLTVYVKPTFLSFPQSVLSLDVETSVTVRCAAYGIPTPTVSWLRNAVPLNATNRYLLLPGGILNITNASLDDSGVFQCFATNDAGQIMASTWIRVTNSVPVISTALRNQMVISGDSVRFECLAVGAPRPTVHWYRVRDGIVESLDDSTGHTQALDTELLIAAVDVEDTATYVCNATNNVGCDSSSAQLTVVLRTIISIPPQSTSAVKGSTISLQCGVIHDESITVVWSWVAVGNEITQSVLNRFRILNNGTLTISSVRSPDDIGAYTCYVVSQAGNDSATADVKVIELPFAPTALTATLSSATVNAVDLMWAAGFNGEAELLRYVLYYRTVTIGQDGTPLSGSWLTYNSNIDATAVSHTVINLRPATSYQFQISAVNAVGEGQPSQPSQIVQLPQQPPSGSPRGVTGSARSNNSIILQWQSPDASSWNGQLLGYIVRYKLAGYQDSTMHYNNVTTFQDSVIYELIGLIIFQEYQIAVAAYNSRGVGVYSPNITVRTSEGRPIRPPTNVSAVAINSTSVRATWFPPNPQFINGINQGYYVELSITVNDSLVHNRFTVASNLSNMLGLQSATLRNLLKYTEYQIAVSCFTSAGVGPESSPSFTVRTLEDVPDAVASMSFTNITDTSLVVVWTPPLHSNGVLTGYTLVYMRKDVDISRVSVDMNATMLDYTITGLAPTTMYIIELSVKTRIGSGPKASADVKSGITPVLPTSPVNLVVNNIQATSVLLQFIAGFDGNTSIIWWIIEAQRSTVSGLWFEVDRVAEPTAVAVLVHNLHPFSTYRLRLIAVNIVGRSSPSDASRWFDTLQAAPAFPPTTVTMRALNETALLVNWVPLMSDVWNGDGRGYLVHYRPTNVADFTGTVTLMDESANSVRLAGLGRWVEYAVQIASFNEVGASEFSMSVFCRTRESVPSAAPSGVSAIAVSSTALQVSWLSVPPALQNGLILGYKIFCQPAVGNNHKSPIVLIASDSNVTTVNVTNLQKYIYYGVQVLAFTAVGDGVVNFPAVNVRTFEDVPGPPSSVYFPDVTLTTARVVWSEPCEPNGVITGYSVAYGLTSPPRIVNNSLNLLQRDYFTSSLEPYKCYVFAITASTRYGWGQSAILEVYTINSRTVPQAPSQPNAGQSQLVGARWVTISWSRGDDGSGPIRNYTIQTQMNDGAFSNITDYVPADVTQFNVTLLRPFSVYHFRVAASNDVGMSSFSMPSDVISTLQAAPDSSPTIVSIRCVTSTSILVSWTLPANDTWNGPLTGYDVSCRVTPSASDSNWQVLSVLTASQLSVTVDGLQLFNAYEVKVRAVNPVGSSIYCQPVTIYMELAPSGRPQNVLLTNVSSSSVIVSWSPPASDTWNGNLLGYKVNYWLTSNTTIVMRHVFRATDTSGVIDSLSPYTQYTLSLLAYNVAGDGPASGLCNITTAESVPSLPSSLLLIVTSPTTVNVSWSAPLQPNGHIINYELTYQQDMHVDGESKSTTVELTADKTSYAAILLIEGMSYVFSLRARSAPGWGPTRSATVVIGSQPGCPGAPGRPEFTVIDKVLTLSWSAPLLSGSELPVTGYIIQARDKAVLNWESLVTMEKSTTTTTTTTTISLFKLKAKSTYQFRVFALNSCGLGLPSDVSTDFLQVTDVMAPDKPFYQQWWFLIIVALIGVIVILLVIGVLCITGRNQHSKQKHASHSLSARQLNGMELAAANNGNYDGDVTFPTFELRKSQRQMTASNGTVRSNHAQHSSCAPTWVSSRSSRNNMLPTRVRSPPRPSPGNVNYNSDDDQKSSADHSSSLSDKASDISSISQDSDSATESDQGANVPSFKTRYANNDVHNSWARNHHNGTAATASFNPYSFSDSEHEGSSSQQAASLNGGLIVINNIAGSRAPLPGFSSFV